MAYRTVTVEVKFKLVMKVDEGTEIGNVIDELDYSFSDQTGNASIDDTEITDFSVQDSR